MQLPNCFPGWNDVINVAGLADRNSRNEDRILGDQLPTLKFNDRTGTGRVGLEANLEDAGHVCQRRGGQPAFFIDDEIWSARMAGL